MAPSIPRTKILNRNFRSEGAISGQSAAIFSSMGSGAAMTEIIAGGRL